MPAIGNGPGRPTAPRVESASPDRDAVRLELALDRISAALVRRAEAEAAAAENHRAAPPPIDDAAVDELRHRLDDVIGRVRSLLGEAP